MAWWLDRVGITVCVMVGIGLTSPAPANENECPADELCIEVTGAELSYKMSNYDAETWVCNISAKVTNGTAYHLLYLSASVGNSTIELSDIGSDLAYNKIFGIDAGTCAAAVSGFTPSLFTIQRCNMEGVAAERACKRMVRVIPPNISTRQTDATAAAAAAIARRKACQEVDHDHAYYSSRLGHCLGTCPSSSRNLTDNCGAACYAANDDVSLDDARNVIAWCIR